jgi:hypothetical protein
MGRSSGGLGLDGLELELSVAGYLMTTDPVARN